MKKFATYLVILALLLSGCGADPSAQMDADFVSVETTQPSEVTETPVATEPPVTTKPFEETEHQTATESTEIIELPVATQPAPTQPVSTQPVAGQATSTQKPTAQPTVATNSSKLEINTAADTVVLLGDTMQIDYSYTGKKPLTWTSDNPSCVTVNQNGIVKGVSGGSATVTVTDGTLSAQVVIHADEMLIRTPSDLVIAVGETLQLDYTFVGDPTFFSWESYDPQVFTIDENGLITGVGSGYGRACACDGYKRWSIYINVIAKEDKTASYDLLTNCAFYDGITKFVGNNLRISGKNSHLRKADGSNNDRISTWTVSANPTNPGQSNPIYPDRNYYITSSNPDVISIVNKSHNGFYDDFLYFNKAGTCVITITSWDGYSESYTIYVKDEYDCAPGKSKLTPGEFAYYASVVCTEDMGEPGCDIAAYNYLYLREDEITWEKARATGHSVANREYQLNNELAPMVVYAGWDEEMGKHLFFVGGGATGIGYDKFDPPAGSDTGPIRFPGSGITIKEKSGILLEVLGDTGKGYVTYTSSNPNIVVASGGFLLAKVRGTAVITATYMGQETSITVTVTGEPRPVKLDVHRETLTMTTWSEGRKLEYTYYDPEGYGRELTWSSSDPTVVMVREDGTICSRGVGECVITLTDGVLSDSCIVTVWH